jgi:hypothetical protein
MRAKVGMQGNQIIPIMFGSHVLRDRLYLPLENMLITGVFATTVRITSLDLAMPADISIFSIYSSAFVCG